MDEQAGLVKIIQYMNMYGNMEDVQEKGKWYHKMMIGDTCQRIICRACHAPLRVSQ